MPLTALTIQIVENVPKTDPVYLFPSQAKNGKTYRQGQSRRQIFSGWSRSKKRLDKASRVFDWRLHDLRRTAATWMATSGVKPHVVEQVINHRSGEISGVAAVYNRATYEKKMRQALEKWSLFLAKAPSAWTFKNKDEVIQEFEGGCRRRAKCLSSSQSRPVNPRI